jgi:cell division protein FtsB
MSTSLRPGFINHLTLYALLGLGFGGSVGLGTVWVQHQIGVEASRNKALEERYDAVVRESEELTTEIARARDPAELLRLNAQWNLGLVRPAEIQAISQDPVETLMAENNHELAGKPNGPLFKVD